MEDGLLLRLLHQDPNVGMELFMDQYAGLFYVVVKGRLADQYEISLRTAKFIRLNSGEYGYSFMVVVKNKESHLADSRGFLILL